mgnify:FL=1|tara:strand:+ start:919 stop:1137 length:219 start_codon:yes stop_codon:yes gene_type:complete
MKNIRNEKQCAIHDVINSAIVRGQLHFVTDGDTVQCWLGEPKGNESEFIFEVHKMFAKDIIAGLTAIQQHCL